MVSQLARQSDNIKRSGAYLHSYQLERDPFSDEGISGLFFPGGGRKQAVDTLLHFSRYGSAPLFLSAAEGLGKTTVLIEFARSVEADIDIAILTAEMLLGEQQLLESILLGLGISTFYDGDAFQQLTKWVAEQSRRDRQVVLCIDNVEHLEKGFIEKILRLVADTALSCKVVFVGEPDAGVLLESLVERQDLLLNSLELSAFTQQDVAGYVDYRLRSAGYHGDFPLSDMQIQAAALRSRGNIEQLNKLLRDLLIAGMDTGRLRTGPRFPVSNLVIAAILASATVYFGWRSIDRETATVSEPIALEAVDRAPSSSDISRSGKTELQADLTNKVPTSLPSGSDSIDKSPAVDLSRIHSNSNQAASAVESLTEMPASVVIASVKSHDSDQKAGDEKSGSGASKTLDTTELLEGAGRDLQGDIDAADSNNKVMEADNTVSIVHQKLQTWPDLGYALQVFGTHNAQRARKLVEQYFGQTDLLFYETRHNGKPWYVVINGPYSGRQSAQQGIELLPESLQRLRPWPRNIASIKSDIERYKAILEIESS